MLLPSFTYVESDYLWSDARFSARQSSSRAEILKLVDAIRPIRLINFVPVVKNVIMTNEIPVYSQLTIVLSFDNKSFSITTVICTRSFNIHIDDLFT